MYKLYSTDKELDGKYLNGRKSSCEAQKWLYKVHLSKPI